ncbi:hypothetical protein A2159_02140, partial [Candidatus Woesebacteria bacterium RBG_13_34_9]
MDDYNLIKILKRNLSNHPEKILLQIKRGYRSEYFTNRQVYEFSQKVSSYLISCGLKKGEKVVIWAPNMPEWVIVFFGSLAIGVIVVPIDVQTTKETARKFIKQTGPKIIFYSRMMNKPTDFNNKIVYLEDLINIICKLKTISKLSGINIKPQDIAEVVFTSGTTGKPRGVILTHKSLYSNILALTKVFPGKSSYRFLSILPLSHMYEQMVGLLSPIYIGASIVYLTNVNSFKIISTMTKNKITSLVVVPEILRILRNNLDSEVEKQHKRRRLNMALKIIRLLSFQPINRLLFGQIHKYLGNHLRFISCGGSPLDLKLERFWGDVGIPILQGYGMTEAGTVIAINTFSRRRLGSVGTVLPGVEIRISSSHEILVRGNNIFTGYYKNPQDTDQVFQSGWFKTGDLGFFDKNNFLFIWGRKKLMIALSDGKKVFPEDIENKLNTHPLVKESCVVGPKRNGGEVIHAVILTDHPNQIDEIIEDVNNKLEFHQRIREYSIYPENDFPRTSALKIRRDEIYTWVKRQHKGVKEEQVALQKDDLTRIIAVTCEVDNKQITENTNLFSDLGLDSLRRLELLSQIEERFAVTIEENKINQDTTVSNLRMLIDGAEKMVKIDSYREWPLKKWASIVRRIFQNFLLFPVLDFFCSPK